MVCMESIKRQVLERNGTPTTKFVFLKIHITSYQGFSSYIAAC